MRLDDLVSAYADDATTTGRALVVLPSAAELLERLPGASAWREDEHTDEPRILLDVVSPGREQEATADVADRLRKGDVAFMLLRLPPEELAIGPLLASLTGHGLRVLEAQGISFRYGRTVLVTTADPELPQRSYLLGSAIPGDDRAMLRQQNEWAVEGLQLRARVAHVEQQVAGAREEARAMRAERDAAVTGASAERRRLEEQLDQALAANRRLRAEQQARAGGRVRKAAALLKDDPVKGSTRILRAAARRLRSH